LYKHEKTCKETKNAHDLEMERMKQTTLQLKLELLKQRKQSENISFKVVNRMLKERSSSNNTMNHSHNTNTNSYNTTHNHNHYTIIVPLGEENVLASLTTEEKKAILDCRLGALDRLVETVHCGSRDEFKNVMVTNDKSNHMHRFDKEKGHFVAASKYETMDRLIECRTSDLADSCRELSDQLDKRTKELIQKLLTQLDDDENGYSHGDKLYANYRAYQMAKTSLLLYNHHEEMTKALGNMIDPPAPAATNDIIEQRPMRL